jgi:glyoxylase I family protein
MRFQRRQLLRILPFAFGSSFLLGRNELGLATQTTTQPKISPPSAGAATMHAFAGGTEKEKVTGIGGLFFRAHDPKVLARWYQQHLGVSLTPSSYEDSVWEQEAGPTVFSPFPETTDYFGDAHKVWMVNFRVRDLDKMAAQLRDESRSRSTRSLIPMAGSPVCMILREIQSSCGNLRDQLFHASLPDWIRKSGGYWSALADDFRTFLLDPDIFELTLSAV